MLKEEILHDLHRGKNDSWCSRGCAMFLEKGHFADCVPIDPPTEGEREATKAIYKKLRKQARAGKKVKE